MAQLSTRAGCIEQKVPTYSGRSCGCVGVVEIGVLSPVRIATTAIWEIAA